MICELPDIPNDKPFELTNARVPVETDCVPAETPNGVSGAAVADAVIVDPASPNVMLLLFENTSDENAAVMRDEPDIPKLTPLLFENTTVPVETLCVPPEIPNGVSPAATADAVIVPPFMPKLMLFEFENTTVPDVNRLPAALTPPIAG